MELDRRLRDRLDRTQRVRWLEVALVEALAEDVADHRQQLGSRAIAAGQGEAQRGGLAPRAEELDIGVAEAVDRLAGVAHEDPLAVGPDEGVQQTALQAVRVLELVHEHEIEALAYLAADLRALEQLAGTLLEVVEVECELGLLARPVSLPVVREERRDGDSDLVLEAGARLELRRRQQLGHLAGRLALRRSEREQLPIGGRPGQQRVDPRQPAQVTGRLRAIVSGERRTRLLRRLAQRREQRRACLRRR